MSCLLTLQKRVFVLCFTEAFFSVREVDTTFISSLSPKDKIVFINTNHLLKCYGHSINSRKLVLHHTSLQFSSSFLLKAAVYNRNQTIHLLLCYIIPDAVGTKQDWLGNTVDVLWNAVSVKE